ncbi:hypothetical protein FOF52_03920 [Thermobifida alba]|uniref:DUF3592 domain-containing protein n=1 Tax=Thermobifida alba TaxID=53522 RepID=A0ABY4KXP6_THEAE|nr:hypothetical protein [Thermobifida alba]UPT20218.1 hypothetical protein FOF52_03920 [Thermobifida alba]HLU97263.1 hypothetical protein [Thermobifida alba]
MNRGWTEWLVALLFAVGAPVAGLVLVVVSTALEVAYGPAWLAENQVGGTLIGLLRFTGYALVLLPQLRYTSFVVLFGSSLAFVLGLFMITDTIEERVLHARGVTDACVVLQVDSRVETSTDSEENTTARTYYDHTLDCLNALATELTTGSRVSEEGEEVDVRYDPADPRPADSVDEPPGLLWPGVALFGVGIVLRLLSELGVPVLRNES